MNKMTSKKTETEDDGRKLECLGMEEPKPETREIPKTIEELELWINSDDKKEKRKFASEKEKEEVPRIARRQERKRLRGICDICARSHETEVRITRELLEEAIKLLNDDGLSRMDVLCRLKSKLEGMK